MHTWWRGTLIVVGSMELGELENDLSLLMEENDF